MTPEELKSFDHIKTNVIRQDIADTIKEINQYQDELKVLRANPSQNRTEIYLREGRILQRKEFILKLQNILDFREIKPIF